MRGYNAFIVNHFVRELSGCRKVADFGAGIGTLAEIFADKTGRLPSCVEIDETNKAILGQRGFPVYDTIDAMPDGLDGFFSSNVLEHIEDDVSVLKQMHAKLAPGGKVALYLPAFQVLYSGLDESVGHYRRYGRKEICSKLKQAGFQVNKVRFVDCIGFFASLLVRFWGYNPQDGLGSQASLNFYDKFVFPVSREIDALGLRMLFGKNILVIAEKPA
nr:methyltransferase domain-containing protein [Roseibium hamelinense]